MQGPLSPGILFVCLRVYHCMCVCVCVHVTLLFGVAFLEEVVLDLSEI